ncbi:MFS transporter [Roseomonas sp. GC11]|uniref:MFS transporter n=1 Tax=Roseomonas sp. GC11 TaxID=2950546 RepID=UPI00210C1F81|nr:MFS transporter [Roseomonas sp. GC11]MCQ4161595.1 MFS transporter [Roseomonas sp. GC11]
MTTSLLRNGEFRSFMLSSNLERFAASAIAVLLGLQVYEIRGNPLDLGLLGLVEAIPGVTLVLYGGHVADQFSRRRIMLLTALALGALTGALALLASGATGHAPLWLLLGIALLVGVARAFQVPAASGLEAQVTPAAQVLRGVSLLATTGRVADILGPVAGGIAWTVMGPAGTYAALTAIFAGSFALLLTGVRERAITYAPRAGESVARRIGEGIGFVFRNQLLIGSMALDLFAVFFGGAVALLPAVASDVLQVGPVGLGFLRAAMSAGSLVAALFAARFLPMHRAGQVLHGVIAGFGVAIIVFGLSTSLPLSLAAFFVAGLCDGTSVVIRRAIMRLASPEAMRGRIAAVRSVFIGSSNELGAFESGIAASLLGVTAAIWSGGIITLGIVGITALTMRQLWALDLVAMAEAEARAG